MYIAYKNKKIQKICTDTKSARKALPQNIEIKRFFRRLRDLGGFITLADIPIAPPFRRHRLSGNRKDEWTIDIQGLHRIHFIPTGDYEKDVYGNPIMETVIKIEIVDIGDFHEW